MFLVDEKLSFGLISSCRSDMLRASESFISSMRGKTEGGEGTLFYYFGLEVTHGISVHMPLVRTGHQDPPRCYRAQHSSLAESIWFLLQLENLI